MLTQILIPLQDNYFRYAGVEKNQGLKFINANIIQTDPYRRSNCENKIE